MKRLFLIFGLLWSALASAQFTPGQLLTAQELNSQFALYAPLAGATYSGAITTPTLSVTSSVSGAGFTSLLAPYAPLASPTFTGTTTAANLTITGTFTIPASTVLPSGVTATTNGRLDNSLQVATDAFVNQQGASAVATVPFANVTGGIYNQATLGSGCQVVVFASSGVITSSLTISNPGSGYAVGDLLAVPAGNSDAVLRVTGVSGGGVTSVGIAYGGTGYTTGNVVTTMGVPPGRRAVVFTGTLTSNLTFIIQSGTLLTASREVEFINNTTGGFAITVKLSNGAGGSTGTGVVLPQGTNNSTALTVYTDGVNDVWLSNTFSGTGAAPINSPTFTGTVTIPSGASISGYLTTASAASTYAPLASPTFTGTVTTSALTATGNFTPSQTNGIVGTTTNNNANTGSVGEYVTATGTAVSLTSATPANCTSISLSAGDWDVWGNIIFTAAGSTIIGNVNAAINTTSATFPASPFQSPLTGVTFAAGAAVTIGIPINRESLSSTTTAFLVAQSAFTVSTETATCILEARRRR
jgi:hypothetical protein